MTDSDAFEPDQRLEQQATSFGAAADLYERGRPRYPAEAVDWLLPEGAQHVLDLGAGTGKLTRLLIEARPGHGGRAVGGMREKLIRAVPGGAVLPGSAERLPIDGESVDAVLVAQAWHWVDPERAVPEVARVLQAGRRPGPALEHPRARAPAGSTSSTRSWPARRRQRERPRVGGAAGRTAVRADRAPRLPLDRPT